MGRIIGTVLGVILAIWLAVTAAGGIFATLKTFVIIVLIALAVFIVVWLLAGRPHRARAGPAASSGGDHQAEDEHGQRGPAPGGDG
jgi:ABC-type bacteriocin/lantibiotic exporter with double-glycine peptidase domain